MSRRDCNLEGLLQFQRKSVEFYQDLMQLSIQLSGKADEAAGILCDEVSAYSLEQVYKAAEEIVKISTVGETTMSEQLNKTQRELDQWQAMQ